MGLIKRHLENAAAGRERSDLGGFITFPDCDPVPCAIGVDTSGLQRADNSAGFEESQTRRVIVRADLIAALPRAPQSGDTVSVQCNLETEDEAHELVISPATGIERYNAILMAFNLYKPAA